MSVSLSRGWFVITHAIDWKNCNEIVGGGVLQEPAVLQEENSAPPSMHSTICLD